jgi:hypothetical protein
VAGRLRSGSLVVLAIGLGRTTVERPENTVANTLLLSLGL